MENTVRRLGYARVSTRGQDLAHQLGKLRGAGCDAIFHEKRSGESRDGRPELARLLNSLRQGDLVLATVTDRIARDPLDMLNILNAVRSAGAGLRLIDEPFIDTSSEMADLIIFLFGWAARLQRHRILENTAIGRESAMRRGVKFGRPLKLTPQQCEEVLHRRDRGETVAKVAKAFGVSVSTILRVPRPLTVVTASLVNGLESARESGKSE